MRSVVAAAGQPVFAKISDYFGRISILVIAVVFYVVGELIHPSSGRAFGAGRHTDSINEGTIVQATAKNLAAFSGGAVLYQFGYTGVQRASTPSSIP